MSFISAAFSFTIRRKASSEILRLASAEQERVRVVGAALVERSGIGPQGVTRGPAAARPESACRRPPTRLRRAGSRPRVAESARCGRSANFPSSASFAPCRPAESFPPPPLPSDIVPGSCRCATGCCSRCRSCPSTSAAPRSVRLVEDLARPRARARRRDQPALADVDEPDVQGALHGRHRRPRGEGHPPRPEQLLASCSTASAASASKARRRPRAVHARARSSASPSRSMRDVELDALGARPARGHARGPRPHAQPARATPPGILDNVREPGALANLIASNFPQAQAQRRRQAGDPRGLRREGARAPRARDGGPPARGPPRQEGDLLDGAGGDGQDRSASTSSASR